MRITREQLKQLIHEEIEEALKIQKIGKAALRGPTVAPEEDPMDALRGPTVAPEEDPADNPLYQRTRGSKLSKVDGKLKLSPPESEDEKMRRQQDLYREESLEEKIYKVVSERIRNANRK